MSRRRGWRKPQGAVYVGRPTRWGNPFRVDRASTSRARAVAVAEYRSYLGSHETLVNEAISALRGRDLACWCSLDQPCHADVLLEVVNRSSVAPPGR
jgi:hypothetical protein